MAHKASLQFDDGWVGQFAVQTENFHANPGEAFEVMFLDGSIREGKFTAEPANPSEAGSPVFLAHLDESAHRLEVFEMTRE